MESQARYVLVGVIVLVLTGLIVVSLLWLSEASSLRNVKSYAVYFKDHPLSGLQEDSTVTMRGIKVGAVRGLQISPKNIEMIRVELALEEDAPIKTDTVATINRNLLTGFATIDLRGGTQDAPPLQDVPPGEPYPLIPEGKTELDEFTNSMPELVEKVSSIADRVNALLSDRNISLITASLENVEKFTTTLAKTSTGLDSMFVALEKAGNEVTRISKSIQEFANNANGQLDDVGNEMSASLKAFRVALENFDQKSTDALSAVGNETRLISQETAAVAQRLGESADTASVTLEGFSNPRKIITGPAKSALGPGEQ